MLNSAKRLCLSSISSSSSIHKYQWNPILDDDYLRLPNFESMLVGTIKDQRLTSDIIKFVNEIYPWPNSLKHVRRLYQSNNQLDIILYPINHSKQIENEDFEKYFQNETKITKVPLESCLLKWQYQTSIQQYWPNLIFRENKSLENAALKKDLNHLDQIILDLFKKIEDPDKENHYAIVVDDEEKVPLVACKDYRDEHPLQHSTMVVIDHLSPNSIYLRENLIEKLIEKKEKKRIY